MTQAAAGMAQMGIGVAVLMVAKIVNDWYPKSAAGYTIMCSKMASCTQGGVALMWKEDHLKFEVKLVLFNNGLNVLTFQLIMGDKQFYIIGAYIPPQLHKGGGGFKESRGGVPGELQMVWCTPMWVKMLPYITPP